MRAEFAYHAFDNRVCAALQKLSDDGRPNLKATIEWIKIINDTIVMTCCLPKASDNGNDQWVFGAGTLGKATSADGTVSNALFLRTDSSVIDMSMNVGMGNGSLDNVGYFEIQNLNTSGTELIIYGH